MAMADFWLLREWQREFDDHAASGTIPNLKLIAARSLRTIEDILGLEPMGLNDGLQGPMTDVFSQELKPWKYKPIVMCFPQRRPFSSKARANICSDRTAAGSERTPRAFTDTAPRTPDRHKYRRPRPIRSHSGAALRCSPSARSPCHR